MEGFTRPGSLIVMATDLIGFGHYLYFPSKQNHFSFYPGESFCLV